MTDEDLMTDNETALLRALRDYLQVSFLNIQAHTCLCLACGSERDRLALVIEALSEYVREQATTITISSHTTYRLEEVERGGNDTSG